MLERELSKNEDKRYSRRLLAIYGRRTSVCGNSAREAGVGQGSYFEVIQIKANCARA